MGHADVVREYAREKYIKPAVQRGERIIKIRAGDVHKALALKNRVPTVCQALESEILLKSNNLVLAGKEGPPSGLSTSVVFTYEVGGNAIPSPSEAPQRPGSPLLKLLELKGIGKEIFAALGGGENFIRAERKAFADAIEKQDRERGIL
jgi:hypothetical protein